MGWKVLRGLADYRPLVMAMGQRRVAAGSGTVSHLNPAVTGGSLKAQNKKRPRGPWFESRDAVRADRSQDRPTFAV
jgi:hypothetical protein